MAEEGNLLAATINRHTVALVAKKGVTTSTKLNPDLVGAPSNQFYPKQAVAIDALQAFIVEQGFAGPFFAFGHHLDPIGARILAQEMSQPSR